MKSIKFSDSELMFIRQQYQVELEEAETYVENLRNILKKINSPTMEKETIEVIEKKRRGRRPKVKKELPVKEVKRRGRKPINKKPLITIEEQNRKQRSDKGGTRNKLFKSNIHPKKKLTL